MHMDIILAILAVLIVIAIVAVVFIKKRQTPLDEEPVAAPLIQEPTPAPIRPATSTDPVAQADILINEQRYEEAAADLKRVLMSNPANTAAMLKLLQIYGLTNNHTAFDKLHHKIHEVGDSQSMQQADFYRSLLEDDVSSSAPTPVILTQSNDLSPKLDESLSLPTPTAEEDSNGLDFDTNQSEPSVFDDKLDFDIETSDLESTTSTIDTPIQHEEEDIGLDFDDFSPNDPVTTLDDSSDDSGLDFDNFTLDESDSVANLDKGLDFNLSDGLDFDESEPEPVSVSSTAEELELSDLNNDLSFESDKPTPSVDEVGLDFDLSFDEPALEETSSLEPETALSEDSTSSENSSTDELSFDDFSLEESDSSFDLEGLDNQAFKDENEEITQLDDDFSFDLSETSQIQPDEADETPSLIEADKEFDFDLDDDITNEISDSNVDQDEGLGSDNVSDDSLIDDVFDDFTFEDTDLTQEQTDNNSLLDDDFTIENDVSPSQIQEQHTDTPTGGDEAGFDLSSDLTFDDTSDFTFDDITDESVDEPVFDDNTGLDDTIKEAQDAQATDTTGFDTSVSQQPAITNDFDFVEDLDKSQITLDLANQYLSLGEHDSAKRLLEEVAKSGNQNQQETATTLLKRIG